MHSNGYNQGYFIGSFFRFLWLLLIASIVQFMFVYIFDANFFTVIVLSVVFSFFINTSFPIANGYPFFRHILINLCVYIVQFNLAGKLLSTLHNFYTPSLLWIILFFCSMIFGILHSIGRYNNGTFSKKIELISNLFLLIIFVSSGFLFWWHGTVIFVIFRTIVISFEVRIANLITAIIIRKYEKNNSEEIKYEYKSF